MDTLEAILTRRSIRKYNDKPIAKETIEKLLKAAMHAPSARDSQPWHFLVVNDKELLQKIAEVHPHGPMCKQAQAAIIPCGEPEADPEYWSINLAAASQNILLAARALDLGSVWLGVHPKEERIADISKLFSIPENITPFCVIPLGYTDVEPKEIDRYQEERVHYNTW